MAELPEGCLLIPNPHNGIAGFTLYEHHFLPGFPEMAWPMLEWLLERYYPRCDSDIQCESSLRVFSTSESELLNLMERMTVEYPAVRLFSLPHLGYPASIELGFRGNRCDVAAASARLQSELKRRHLLFRQEVAA